jgi:hypothetical protein
MNYNPNDQRDFTDKLTLEAMKNLGVTPDQLFYPTKHELFLYTRDPEMQDVMRTQIIERVNRTRDAVETEVDRLAQMAPPQRSESVNLVGFEERSEMFFDMEKVRMEKIKLRNQKEAAQIILSILVENEIVQEELELKREERQQRLQREEEQRIKMKEEREAQMRRIQELQVRDRERLEELRRRQQEAEDQEKRYLERKAEVDLAMKEYHESLDRERIRKNEEARRKVLEFEAQRREDWEQRKRELEERDAAMRQRREEEQREREERNQQEARRKEMRLAEIHENHRALIESKRQRTKTKQEQQEATFERFQTARREELDRLKAESAEHQAAAKLLRDSTFENNEREKREKFDRQEARRTGYYSSKLLSEDRNRRREAAERLIRLEERKMVSERLSQRRLTKNIEVQNRYEERLKAIEDREAKKRQMIMESQAKRNELERQKADLESGAISPVELRRKGVDQLQGIARTLGIDLASLQEQAKAFRRQRSTSRSQSALPPVAPR